MSKPQVRLLLVEDDVVDRMACRRALSLDPDYEFVLTETETGREGLQVAHEQKPDCVLLDYHLPDMNGLEFLAELSNDLGEIPVPVMMLTGTDNASVAVDAMKCGAQDYLVKDTSRQYLDMLPTVIQRVLRERRALVEKKQMSDRLVQAEAKYRFLVEHIPAITYTSAIDTPGKLLYVSPQLSMLGYTPDEWTSQVGALRSRIHPDDQKLALDAFDRVRATGKSTRCEFRLLSRSGEVHWFMDEASLVHDDSGMPLFLQGILIDITEGKKVEEELRLHRRHIEDLVAMRTTQFEKQVAVLKSANANLTSELRTHRQAEEVLREYADRLADFYNNAPCGYHSLDAAGVFVQVNDTELRWYDRTHEEVVGKMKFADLLTPESGKAFEEIYSQFRAGGTMCSLALDILRADGTSRSVLLSTNAIKDADGRLMTSRSVMVDITDLNADLKSTLQSSD